MQSVRPLLLGVAIAVNSLLPGRMDLVAGPAGTMEARSIPQSLLRAVLLLGVFRQLRALHNHLADHAIIAELLDELDAQLGRRGASDAEPMETICELLDRLERQAERLDASRLSTASAQIKTLRRWLQCS